MSVLRSILLATLMNVSLFAHAQIAQYFDQIKNNKQALYALLKKMPKGGELHDHLEGSASPEMLLNLPQVQHYCVNTQDFSVTTATPCKTMTIAQLKQQPLLYEQLIQSWSMKHFVSEHESKHEHFFNTFGKFMPLISNNRAAVLTDIIQRAAKQNILYLELMTMPDDAQSAQYGDLIIHEHSYEQKRQILLSHPKFQKNIDQTLKRFVSTPIQAREYLGCARQPSLPACTVNVKFLYYILREQDPDHFFAQALAAFEMASRAPAYVVGVNTVQPEEGILSLRHYHEHMAILNYLHEQYPQVNISLHAGELAPKIVKTYELRYHIDEALHKGHAQRIGHGSDIAFEKNSQQILNYMAQHHIAVEICLSSSSQLLDLSGENHPLHLYLTHHVPVVLSTDDEGVLGTDLTHQYVKAVIDQKLDYAALKQINRNALAYSFLPGTSIWQNLEKEQLATPCQNLNSAACHQFITNNEKGKVQWALEQALAHFESHYH